MIAVLQDLANLKTFDRFNHSITYQLLPNIFPQFMYSFVIFLSGISKTGSVGGYAVDIILISQTQFA